MRLALFCHSIRSDWNHGNAHFLRGVLTELEARGHETIAYEPRGAWSVTQLQAEDGPEALEAWREAYPHIRCAEYEPDAPDLDRLLDGIDAVLVHEWTPPQVVAAIGRYRARGGRFVLLFHDTHHRSVTQPDEIGALELDAYDGVLAFGEVVREAYVRAGWHRRAWTWHEAADTRVFRPVTSGSGLRQDLVWIGNWGDEERTTELNTFLFDPVRQLGLRGHVHGVRYPANGLAAVRASGLTFGGRIANHRAPAVYARHRVTVHVPRRPYARQLPGIPTIRVFEALACGIPLICAPWEDSEQLFTPGRDYLVAHSGPEMVRRLRDVLADRALAASLREHGLQTIASRHTCAHRVRQLLAIIDRVRDTIRESEVA